MAIHHTNQSHGYVLQVSDDDKQWQTICDKSDSIVALPHDMVHFKKPVTGRFVKIVNHHIPADGKFALCGLRVFGTTDQPTPVAVNQIDIQRHRDSSMDAALSWPVSSDAIGYNVLWGTSPDKLYHSWLVYDQNQLHLGALDHDRAYHVRIDAFNEGGITLGQVVKMSMG